MTNRYVWVSWNTHKKVYDLVAAACALAFIAAFFILGKLLYPPPNAFSDEVLLLRALGTAAIVLLHIILMVGPLARLSTRFAPLLYNRRHLGVMLFFIALAHAALATLYYGAFGNANPISAVLFGHAAASVSAFPFELLGALALVILFLMAATSHDFWLANLSPRAWKWLHMLVYPAYALVIAHVALGVMQTETTIVVPILLALGVLTVGGLHTVAGYRSLQDLSDPTPTTDHWLDAGPADAIPLDRARPVKPANSTPIAVYRYTDEQGVAISAISGVCAHQAGPLAEGKVIDGCVTCPWHGYQYRPADGCSPPPYTEKLATHAVRITNGRVLVNPEPNAPGTHVEPARPNPARPGGTRDA